MKTKQTTSKVRSIALATALLICASALFLLLRSNGESVRDTTNHDGGAAKVSALPSGADPAPPQFALIESAPGAEKEEVAAIPSESLAARLEEVFAKLATGAMSPGEVLELLRGLRAATMEEDPGAAAAAIIAFLESGRDANTGLSFAVGRGGVLDESPTLRTELLDLLGQTDVAEAAEYAVKIFAAARSADEWALAMRNIAWSEVDGEQTGRLAARFDEMLDNQDWLDAPSAGFLEAFDIAVSIGGAEQVANLASVLGVSEGSGLEGAAFIALDRLTVGDADTVLEAMEADPTLLGWSPEKRASLFARADVTDPEQLRALESYLGRDDLGAEEREVFADLFPLRSYTDGPRLVTGSEDTGRIDLRDNDLAALEAVEGWIADGRLADSREMLGGVRERLDEYAQEIGRSALEPEPVIDPDGAGSGVDAGQGGSGEAPEGASPASPETAQNS